MLELRRGDILNAEAEALVNTVNCVGAMGRGIALQFRKAFPDNFKAYQAACERGEVEPGVMFTFATGQLTNPHYIINFPTKRHWRGKSRIEDIEVGLQALVREIERLGISSVAIPPLGCGLGGLRWSQVRPRIERALESVPHIEAIVFEPVGAPAAGQMVKAVEAPAMTAGRAALLGLMHRYLSGLMDPFVSLLELHKLMYFMQVAGEHLQLRYAKAPYGPYAENLRHVLNAIEGHFIAGYADAEDDPEKQIELMEGAAEKALEFLDTHHETQDRFDRVVDLVDGFETPFGMELLSSVHWAATRDRAGENSIHRAIYDWNPRKRRFRHDQIRIAWDVLGEKGWFHPD